MHAHTHTHVHAHMHTHTQAHTRARTHRHTHEAKLEEQDKFENNHMSMKLLLDFKYINNIYIYHFDKMRTRTYSSIKATSFININFVH